MGRDGVDSTDSGQGLVIDLCEHCNEPITGREYLDCKGVQLAK